MRKVQVLSGTKGFWLFTLVFAAFMVCTACKQPADSAPVVPQVPVINITSQPADITVAEGDTENLSVSAAGAGGAAVTGYQWYSSTSASNAGGTPIDGATEARFAIPNNLAVGEYYYFCEITASGGAASVRSRAAKVTVSTEGEFVIQLSYIDDPNLIEQTAYSTVGTDKLFSIAGTDYTEYQWYINGESVSTGIYYVFNKSAGSYELAVVVSNAAGEKYSGRCHVTVR